MAQVIVLGAGIAGALGAHALQAAGHRVTVLDKGHMPGGRLATRSVGGATFDTGAQFFTAQSEVFRAHVDRWLAAEVARVWFHGAPDHDAAAAEQGHPRYRGSPTMRQLAQHLVMGLDVQLGTVVRSIAIDGGRVRVTAIPRAPGSSSRPVPQGSGSSAASDRATTTWTADAILLTAPVPQALDLLAAGSTTLSRTTANTLDAATYDPTVTVLAVPDGPTQLPARGAIRAPDGDIEWIADNQATGASQLPALTIHASTRLSRALLDHDDAEVGRAVTAAAADLLGTTATPVHVHRWRYARPTTVVAEGFLLDQQGGAPLVLAGDAFRGGRVEGAALSGLEGAAALTAALRD